LPLFSLQLLVDCCFSAAIAVAVAATIAVAVVVNAVAIAAVTIIIAAVGKRMTIKPLGSLPPCFATFVCRNWSELLVPRQESANHSYVGLTITSC
jgi:hypothetical protein